MIKFLFLLPCLALTLYSTSARSAEEITTLASPLESAKIAAVQFELSNIAELILLDYITEDQLPNPDTFSTYLQKRMQTKGNVQRDPALDFWEMPYILRVTAQSFSVISSGPDQKLDTEDDLRASQPLR